MGLAIAARPRRRSLPRSCAFGSEHGWGCPRTGPLDLSWRLPVGGGAVTGYSLLVSGAFEGSVPTTARSLSATVARGTYSVRIVATNSCGTGPPMPPQTVTATRVSGVKSYLDPRAPGMETRQATNICETCSLLAERMRAANRYESARLLER
jgi:hypothetical protein